MTEPWAALDLGESAGDVVDDVAGISDQLLGVVDDLNQLRLRLLDVVGADDLLQQTEILVDGVLQLLLHLGSVLALHPVLRLVQVGQQVGVDGVLDLHVDVHGAVHGEDGGGEGENDDKGA